MERLCLGLKMVDRLRDKVVHLLELAGEAVDQVFFLGSHLIGRQVPHIFDLFLQLFGQFVEEGIGIPHLLRQVLLVAPNVPKDLDPELRKVVFKANEVAFQRFVLVLVRFEVLVLLLGHLFAEVDLLEGVHEFGEEVVVRFVLLLFVRSAPVRLLLFHQVNVLFQLVVALLQPLNLLLQQPDLLISMILPSP